MSCSILKFAWGKAGFCRRVGEVVESMSVDFRNASAEK